MLSGLYIEAKQACAVIASLLIVEVALVVVTYWSLSAAILAVLLGIISSKCGKCLAKPLKKRSPSRLAIYITPALLVVSVGVGILISRNCGWTTWFCAVGGYVIGNHLKAAGSDRARQVS